MGVILNDLYNINSKFSVNIHELPDFLNIRFRV